VTSKLHTKLYIKMKQSVTEGRQNRVYGVHTIQNKLNADATAWIPTYQTGY